MISVTAIADTAYCEYVAYLKHILKVPPTNPNLYYYGLVKHTALEQVNQCRSKEEMIARAVKVLESKASGIQKHGLNYNSILQELLREIQARPISKHPLITEKFISSELLGFRGRVDHIELCEGLFIPHEYKSRFCEERVDRDSVQLAAYGLLIEQELGHHAPYGILTYGTKSMKIQLDEKINTTVLACRDRFCALLKGSAPLKNGACANCLFNDKCSESNLNVL